VSARILIVDDDRSMCDLIETDLRRRGYAPESVGDAAAALELVRGEDLDVVLTDLNMPGMSGIELCERVAAHRPDVPVIVITAFGSLESAISAIKAGAYDFVTKPIDLDILAVSIERALNHRALKEQIKILSGPPEEGGCGELVGRSRPMLDLCDKIVRVADSEASVLITGESGTGKELVARALHSRSRRARGPFVAFNCAALPESLLESELFGHRRGAFTDAREDKRGLLVEASGGTLLLDEVGDIPPAVQPKLLRALEERRVRPLGGASEITFDARVIAATHRDLEEAMEAGAFRDDLYYRLNVIKLSVPPLRSRGTDILLLARRFVAEYAGRSDKPVTAIAEPAVEKLLAYSWPGNVRELRNAMERAVALARHDKIVVEDMPEAIRDYEESRVSLSGSDPNELVPLDELERRYILHVLRASGGNRSMAARILGLDRKTLYRKLHRYGEMGEGEEDA
jgi:DNA-binding NtrC family response regulator